MATVLVHYFLPVPLFKISGFATGSVCPQDYLKAVKNVSDSKRKKNTEQLDSTMSVTATG